MIHIALCTDINYLMPTGVAMVSICENNQDEEICFHVVGTIDNSISKDAFSVLNDIANKYGKEYHFYQIQENKLPTDEGKTTAHITKTAFSRMFLADLLPYSINKVLYLDCDIICQGKLTDCWNVTLSEHDFLIGGVEDASCYSGYVRESLSLKITDLYVNSGVLLINLKQWRDEGVGHKCVDQANLNKYRFMDQDVINTVCRGRIFRLPFKYNLQTGFTHQVELFWMIDGCHMKEARKAKQSPVIIHYTANKPWKIPESDYSAAWMKYYYISPWKNIKLKTKQVHPFILSPYYHKIEDLYWKEFSFVYETFPFYLSLVDMIHNIKIFIYKRLGRIK